MSVLSVACTKINESDHGASSMLSDDSIKKDGFIYTPVGRSSQGCVIYSIAVGGGLAPDVLVHQSVDGEFSYDTPDECVK